MNRFKIEVATVSDKGLVKQSNQDNILVQIGEHNGSEFGLFIVCDGLGGLAFGEVASVIAVKHFKNWWNNKVSEFIKRENKEVIDSLVSVVKAANLEIIDYSNVINQRVGTTVSALLILRNKYYIVHVGDSRVYSLKRRLEQLTEDHSYVAMEVKRGNMTKEEARASKKKNLLMQCVGVKECIDIFVTEGNLQENEMFLLCSDGFYNTLNQYEIERTLNNWRFMKDSSLQLIANTFVDKVKERKERDNISVIICYLASDEEKSSIFKKIFKY